MSAWHLLYKITSPALKMGHSSGWNGARGAVGYHLCSPGADIYFEAKWVGKMNFEKKAKSDYRQALSSHFPASWSRTRTFRGGSDVHRPFILLEMDLHARSV